MKPRKKDRGFCPRCKNTLDSEAHKKCLLALQVRGKKRHKKAVAGGYCVRHPDRTALVTKGACEECWFQSAAYSSLGSRTKWREIKKLLLAQNHKCAYTGEQLTLGVNAGLDHKIPLTRKGQKIINNLHFTTISTNNLKSDLTHEEFLWVCQYNYDNQQNCAPDDVTQIYIEIWRYQLLTQTI